MASVPFVEFSTIAKKPFSIEICLRTTTEDSSYIGHIFTILGEKGSENFFVGQWKSHLILRKTIYGKKTYREIGIRGVLKKIEKRFVTISSGTDGTRIYVDGILIKSGPRFQVFSMDERPSGKIVLGNSPTGSEYWTGQILCLAIYDHVLTEEDLSQHFNGPKKSGEEAPVSLYLFDEHSRTLAHDSVGDHHLLIPSRFKVLKKTILIPPREDFRFNVLLGGPADQSGSPLKAAIQHNIAGVFGNFLIYP
jgi:hypothetical protein